MIAQAAGFRHEALLYAGEADYLAGTVAFVREGVAFGESVLVAVPAAKLELMRTALGSEAESVRWVDMSGIGGNPARIIPLWREFVARHRPHGPLRGIGEPIWAQRTAAEMAEAQRHEALLNLAFAGASGLTILCPYDIRGLDPGVLEAAHGSHPLIVQGASKLESAGYHHTDSVFAEPLPPPPSGATESVLDSASLVAVRGLIAGPAEHAGLSQSRSDDMALAVTAAAAALAQGDAGLLALSWHDGGAAVCELRSSRHIEDPLAGREWPPAGREPGHGLWVAHQVADLVELRSSSSGTVARLRVTAQPHAAA
jgi:hypothetical protein